MEILRLLCNTGGLPCAALKGFLPLSSIVEINNRYCSTFLVEDKQQTVAIYMDMVVLSYVWRCNDKKSENNLYRIENERQIIWRSGCTVAIAPAHKV